VVAVRSVRGKPGDLSLSWLWTKEQDFLAKWIYKSKMSIRFQNINTTYPSVLGGYIANGVYTSRLN